MFKFLIGMTVGAVLGWKAHRAVSEPTVCVHIDKPTTSSRKRSRQPTAHKRTSKQPARHAAVH